MIYFERLTVADAALGAARWRLRIPCLAAQSHRAQLPFVALHRLSNCESLVVDPYFRLKVSAGTVEQSRLLSDAFDHFSEQCLKS